MFTFLATWECASDFIKMLSKWPPEVYFKFFCGLKNSETQILLIFLILLSHSPRYGDVQVIFLLVLLKFKMAATDQLHNFLWTHKLRSIKLFNFFYHIPHDMEMCRCFFRGLPKIQNGCHISTSYFLCAQKL